jgi:hypothetical protein
MVANFTGDVEEVVEVEGFFVFLEGEFLFFYVGLLFFWEGGAGGEILMEVF